VPAPAPAPDLAAPTSGSVAADLRFRALLGEEAWLRLPHPVRERFSKRLAPGAVALYRGRVETTELSLLGWVLAQATRLIGAPLPTMNHAVGPAVVMVSDDAASGGQRWLRLYERPRRKPQMVVSTKRFRGETGLEEDVGAGIGMQLRLSVEDGALVFRSHRYRLAWRSYTLVLPRFISPGIMTIVHTQELDGGFSFRLTLDHPLFGRLLHQLAYFEDV
jgi:hypothetical protein